jgi:serine/threonine protein kinase/tetratricopeptide (TPR) repeat protein
MIGQTISHYKILEKLGGGGMGVVYKAEDTKLKRFVALKFLPPELTRDDEAKERFVHEAQAASALDHPNICTIYEIDETEDGQIFIAMACYEGETLKKRVAKGEERREKGEEHVAPIAPRSSPFAMTGGLPVVEVIDIAIQIAQGLAKAHQHGIVHRDIKPANVIVTNDGAVKIIDFGLAKLMGTKGITKTPSTMGTVAYMSPEQTQGEPVDHRTDIWSLGVVLYEMLTGQLPFKGEYDQAVVYSILNEEPKPITRLRPELPTVLEQIVEKALQKERTERYQRMEELLADLRQLKVEPTPQEFFSPLRLITKVSPKKSRPLVLLGIVLAISILALLGYFIITPSKSELTSQRKMLAVLPFENLGQPEDEYFADGITEEIIAKLTSIDGLGVIARTSIIQYKNTDKPIPKIGEELKVEYILRGTIRWQRHFEGKNKVRVTPQLIKVVDATYLWSRVYEKDLADIFQVQSDIAIQVVEALDITLLESKRRYLEARPTHNLEAYDYYLHGEEYLHRSFSQEDWQIAAKMFQKAIALDPGFALAYARLAWAQAGVYWIDGNKLKGRLTQAKNAVDKALQLNPELPQAHLALGYYHYWGSRDYERALEQFIIAQKSQPNFGELYQAIGCVQRRQGKFDAALNNMEKAVELDPRSADKAHDLADTYEHMRMYAEAERYYDRAIAFTPDWLTLYIRKARLYLFWEGRTEKARAAMAQALNNPGIAYDSYVAYWWILLDVFDRNFQNALSKLSLVSLEAFDWQDYFIPKTLLAGQLYELMNEAQLKQVYYDSARSILEIRVHERPDDPRFHSSLGIAYAGLGRKEEAMREGKKAVELLPVSKDAITGAGWVANLARIYVMVGEYDAAIDQLEFLLSIPGKISIPFLKLDPTWDVLRQHPKFRRLLAEYSSRHAG